MNYFNKYLKYKKKYLLLLGGSVNELYDFNIMCNEFEHSILNMKCKNYLVLFSKLINYYNNNDNMFKTDAKKTIKNINGKYYKKNGGYNF